MNNLNPESWVHPSLFAVIPTGLVLLDSSCVVVDLNPVAERMLGQSIVGRCWDAVMNTHFITRSPEETGLVLVSGASVQIQTCLLPDNSGRLVMMQEIIASGQELSAVAADSHDKNLGQVLSSMIHELRTPLTTAMLLADRLQESSGSRQAATRLQAQLSRIESKVNDLLLLAKGGQILHDFTDAEALYETWKNEVQHNREWQSISFLWSCESDVAGLRLRCNLVALRSAIYNLISNACEAGARRVLVDFYRKAGNLVVRVADDGAGMTPEVLHMAKQLQFSTRPTGAGLGLPLVETVAQAHMGFLDISSHPGEGTQVCLTLSLDQLQQPQQLKEDRGC